MHGKKFFLSVFMSALLFLPLMAGAQEVTNFTSYDGKQCQMTVSGGELDWIESVDPDTIEGETYRPLDLDQYGLWKAEFTADEVGGTITVHGDVSGWAGAEIRGGVIEIHGNAGDYLASSYRGSTKGMHNGKIIVHGNVGSDVAVFMHGGTIKIYGNTEQFLGFRMSGGTIYVEKNAETRVGACMTGGKIVVSGFLEEVLPTFTIDRVKSKVKIEENEKVSGPFYVFLGDLAEKSNGKLFVSKGNNPHLSQYEKFL